MTNVKTYFYTPTKEEVISLVESEINLSYYASFSATVNKLNQLSDTVLIDKWTLLANQHDTTQTCFARIMSGNRGNYSQFYNGTRRSRLYEGKYVFNQCRGAILLWFSLPWYQGLLRSYSELLNLVKLIVSSEMGSFIDESTAAQSPDERGYYLFSPDTIGLDTCKSSITDNRRYRTSRIIKTSCLLTLNLYQQRLLSLYEEVTQYEDYRAIIFVDIDNVSFTFIMDIIDQMGDKNSPIFIIAIGNAQTIETIKIPDRDWIIALSSEYLAANQADLMLLMEIKSCLNEFMRPNVSIRRQTPLELIIISEDNIFHSIVLELSSLISKLNLDAVVNIDIIIFNRFGIILNLIFLLPEFRWRFPWTQRVLSYYDQWKAGYNDLIIEKFSLEAVEKYKDLFSRINEDIHS